jgi:diamine N-acetyltransferase
MTEIIPVKSPADLEQVAALACEIWQEHYPPIIGAAQTAYMLEKFQSVPALAAQIQAGCLYYLLRDENGRDLGYLALQPLPDELFLSKLYVLAARRREGHARAGLVFAREMARSLNLPRIMLTVNRHNAAALAAYARLGFALAGDVVTDIGRGFVMDDHRLEILI